MQHEGGEKRGEKMFREQSFNSERVKTSGDEDADRLIERAGHREAEFVGRPVERVYGLRAQRRLLQERHAAHAALRLAVLALFHALLGVRAVHIRVQ